MASGNLDMDDEELEEKVDKFESSCRGTLMKLYMLACKNAKEQRAYEIATIMDSDSLQLAIKYATKSRSLVLAQKLNLLAEKKAEIESKQVIGLKTISTKLSRVHNLINSNFQVNRYILMLG